MVSVEGGTCPLPRAPLSAVLAAAEDAVEVIDAPPGAGAGRGPTLVRRGPFRPRARVLPAPAAALTAHQRILALTGALVDREPPQTLVLDPSEAATELLDHLRRRGYLR